MSEPLQIVCPHCNAVNRVTAARLGDAPNCGKCHEALFSGQPVGLHSTNFKTHIRRSNIPIVVDFWAPWCGPCKAMAPAFEQAAKQLEPQVRLAKVDTEQAPDIGAQYGIKSIPTLVMFASGQEVARQSGAMMLADIVRWVESHLDQ